MSRVVLRFRVLPLLLACLLFAGDRSAEAAPRRRARHKRPAAAAKPIDAASVNDPGLVTTVGPGARGAAVLRAQILLDRAHFSPGEIDGRWGATLKSAIAAFQASRGLAGSGVVDADTWKALDADGAEALASVQVAPEDVAGPFVPIPEEMTEKAALPALGFTSPLEGLAEKYHASPALLIELNPGATFGEAGQTIVVPNVAVPPPGKAAKIVVSKSGHSVAALDADGRTVAWYPASSGSEHDPLPIGEWKIKGVSRNPEFHYNPTLFWDAKPGDEKARIAPGPNNPVGVAWIDLSKPHYGIHGTPEPSRIGRTESHGCIRMTNWSVWELQQMVSPGTPAILEP